jgi:hypothetical protein
MDCSAAAKSLSFPRWLISFEICKYAGHTAAHWKTTTDVPLPRSLVLKSGCNNRGMGARNPPFTRKTPTELRKVRSCLPLSFPHGRVTGVKRTKALQHLFQVLVFGNAGRKTT